MKLVIVEDEEIIREGLLGSIDWKGLGIEVVGQAEDGEQAEAVIERTHPDIVVSDIRIPFVDGLTLAERVTARHPGTAIVIISGFDDFGYAQKALKIGVEDYILKPIDLDNFARVLAGVRRKIEQRAREKREIEQLRDGAARSQRILQERLLRDLVDGRLPQEEAERRLPELFSPGSWFAALRVEIDDDALTGSSAEAVQRREMARCLEETLVSLAGRGMFLLEEAGVQFALGASDRQKEPLARLITSAERTIRRCCERFPAVPVTVGIGGAHEGTAGLMAACREAREACACRYILGPGGTIQYDEIRRLTEDRQAARLFHDSDLIWAVTLGDRRAIHDNLSQLLAEISRAGEGAARRLEMYVANIFLRSLDAVLDEGGTVEEVFADPIAVYNSILSRGTAAQAIEALEEALGEVATYLETDRAGGQRHVVEKAKRYIRRNFGRSELGLAEVADYVKLSPSYFSSVFRSAEGCSFMEYLSELRMDRAKELLLRSPYPAGEIADMVGYSSPAYFSSTFKKYAGCSPGEFRKIGKKEG